MSFHTIVLETYPPSQFSRAVAEQTITHAECGQGLPSHPLPGDVTLIVERDVIWEHRDWGAMG